jgi:integrase
MTTGLSGRFQLPSSESGHRAPLSDQERITHLGRVLTAGDLPLRTRAAAAIVLLYAQPASRIVRLTLDDVILDGGEVQLRLGEPPSPVPEPVAGLLVDWISRRTNMRTATNRDSRWLFPGRRAGQPMGSDYLTALLRGIGIPTTACRTSAIRQQVLEMPPPVVADALGYHPVTTARLAAQAAATFSRYAPRDHTRPLPTRGPGKGEP